MTREELIEGLNRLAAGLEETKGNAEDVKLLDETIAVLRGLRGDSAVFEAAKRFIAIWQDTGSQAGLEAAGDELEAVVKKTEGR